MRMPRLTAAGDDAQVQGGRFQAAAGGELADQLPVELLPRGLRGRDVRFPQRPAAGHFGFVHQQVDAAGVEVDHGGDEAGGGSRPVERHVATFQPRKIVVPPGFPREADRLFTGLITAGQAVWVQPPAVLPEGRRTRSLAPALGKCLVTRRPAVLWLSRPQRVSRRL